MLWCQSALRCIGLVAEHYGIASVFARPRDTVFEHSLMKPCTCWIFAPYFALLRAVRAAFSRWPGDGPFPLAGRQGGLSRSDNGHEKPPRRAALEDSILYV